MPLSIHKYLNIKNNYCVCYYGLNKEYVVQLRALRPIIENQYKGVNIYISVEDNNLYLLRGEDKIIPKSEINIKKQEVSYVREIFSSLEFHSVEKLIEESEIKIDLNIKQKNTKKIEQGAILTKGNFPNRSLNFKQIEAAENFLYEKGIKKIKINPSYDDFEAIDMIIGVENEITYEYALKGIKTYLVPTGNGEKLFLKMFPKNELIHLV